MQVVRLTVDLFREVPVDLPLTIETNVVRDGRRIQVADAAILAAGRKVARASGLKIRTTDVAVPSANARWEQPPGRDEAEVVSWGRFGFEHTDHERFHSHGIEIRTIDDSFLTMGEGLSWLRLTVLVVEGEETTPFVRTAALADGGNGNSMALDGREWLYVNPDVNLSCIGCLKENGWGCGHSPISIPPGSVAPTPCFSTSPDRSAGSVTPRSSNREPTPARRRERTLPDPGRTRSPLDRPDVDRR